MRISDWSSDVCSSDLMVAGRRELMLGMLRDPQYGPCVSFGLGGIFAEALDDIAFRIAPLTRADAAAMLDEIRAAKVLGAVAAFRPSTATPLSVRRSPSEIGRASCRETGFPLR